MIYPYNTHIPMVHSTVPTPPPPSVRQTLEKTTQLKKEAFEEEKHINEFSEGNSNNSVTPKAKLIKYNKSDKVLQE